MGDTSIVISIQYLLYLIVPFVSLVAVGIKRDADNTKNIELLKLELEYLKEKVESFEEKLDSLIECIYAREPRKSNVSRKNRTSGDSGD